MSSMTALRRKWAVQAPALLFTIGLMWLLPFLIHLIPSGNAIPLGARLLPIFYAPLLAVWLFHPAVALASSLLMPYLNHALTGMPTFEMALILSAELSVFSLVALALRQRWPRLPLTALVAVIAGKVVSALLLFVIPLVPLSPWAYLTSSTVNAMPGLLVLLALNLTLIRLCHER